jgi:hypothetical protein
MAGPDLAPTPSVRSYARHGRYTDAALQPTTENPMSATNPHTSALVLWRAALAVLGLVACQSATITPGFAPVAAPKLAVGDHWQYKITDNLRLGLVTMLGADVVSISGDTAALRLVYNNQYGRSELTEEIDAGGGLVVGALKQEQVRHFQTPVELYDFPLEQGKTWRQVVDTISPDTQLKAQILLYGTVQGQTVVTVPAGTFNTTYVYRVIQLDDEQFWRTRTSREDSVWFAPEMKGPVRELRNAYYVQTGGGPGALVRTENTTRELISFQPGAR